jgi:large subunit ribosomal protein L19
MQNPIIEAFEKKHFPQKLKHPDFKSGDTICVDYRIEEGVSKEGKQKFRIQSFEGICIRVRKGTASASFTVRKMSANSVGVERIFPLHSPFIENIKLLASGKVRRARLNYLRDLSGKAARIKSLRIKAGALRESQPLEGAQVTKSPE